MPPKKRTSSAAAEGTKAPKTAKVPKTKATGVTKNSKNSKNAEDKMAGDGSESKSKRKHLNKDPYPEAPLNHRVFPHILDTVLKYPESWFPLRATSKVMQKRVEPLMYEKIEIAPATFLDWGKDYNDDRDYLSEISSSTDEEGADLTRHTKDSHAIDQVKATVSPRLEALPRPDIYNDGPIDIYNLIRQSPELFNEQSLLTVTNHHSRLPNFPPRRYMNKNQGQKYQNQRKRWSALLKNHTKVVDVCAEMNMCHLDYLNDALTNFHTLRIFLIEGSGLFFHYGFPPISGFKKLVLMCRVPGPEQMVSDNIKMFGDTCKVVTNVLYASEAGPFHPLLHGWRAYKSNAPQSLTDVVFIFKSLTEAGFDTFYRPEDYQEEADTRWELFLTTVIFQLQPESEEKEAKILKPTVTIVDFPEDVNLSNLPHCKTEELSEMPTATDRFRNAIKNGLVALQALSPNEYRGQAATLFARVKFLSLSEYAATLKPGELAIETSREL